MQPGGAELPFRIPGEHGGVGVGAGLPTTATFRPASPRRSLIAPARASAPAGSAASGSLRCRIRIASRASSSGTAMMREAPRRSCSTARGRGSGWRRRRRTCRRLGGDRRARPRRTAAWPAPVGDDADDLGGQAEQVADRHHAADARAHADRHVDDVEVGAGVEQLAGVRRDAEHEVGSNGADHAGRAVGQRSACSGPPGSRRRGRRARRRGRPSPRSSRRCCPAARRS